MPGTELLVVGSANLDLVFRAHRLPAPGETLLGHEFATHPGGKGANQAVAAGKLGGEVAIAGCVGQDPNGQVLLESLENAGVSTRHLLRSETSPSGTAGIFVGEQGANMIVVAPGANAEVTAGQVVEAVQQTQPNVVLAQLEVPIEAVVAAGKVCKLVLNPAPARDLPSELVQSCFLLTPNEGELLSLTGKSGVDGAQALLQQGAENVVVTLGENGCLWVSKAGVLTVPARTVDAIDTTAAGDAFSGSLSLFLAQGDGFEQALPKASAVAALSTTKRGAQESMPTLEEVRRFAPDLF